METPCTPWTGRINEYGYGTWGVKLAHRVLWAEQHGPIPDGLTIDHMCHDPEVCNLGNKCPHRRCVNVDHMSLVTAAENRNRRHYHARTHCPRGHAYEGDNVLVYSGRTHCATCRRSAERDRRQAAKIEACAGKGHDRDERVGPDGRRYCVICITANANKAAAARWNRT